MSHIEVGSGSQLQRQKKGPWGLGEREREARNKENAPGEEEEGRFGCPPKGGTGERESWRERARARALWGKEGGGERCCGAP